MKSYRYLIVTACAILLIAQFPKAIERQALEHIDFPIFYEAASHHGVAAGYIYPPFFAWAISPLTALSENSAASVWYVIHALAVLAALGLSLPAQFPRGWFDRFVLVVALASATRLIILNAELGQVNALILLLLLLSFRTRSGVLAGGFIAVAALIKITPLLALPFLLFGNSGKRVALLVGFVAVAACGMAMPVAFGYSFAGLLTLGALPSQLVGNISPAAFLPRPAFFVLGLFLAAIALLVGYRSRKNPWLSLFPLFLMILLPALVRKAHLLFGMPSMSLSGGGHRVGRLAPLCWAVGSLGTMVLPVAAPLGMIAALCCCFYTAATGKAADVTAPLPEPPHHRI